MDEPFAKGADHPIDTEDVVARVCDNAVAGGAARGVRDGVKTDMVEPDALKVSTRATYGVPFAKPVIVVGETSFTPGVHSVNEAAAEVLYNTFAEAGEVQETVSEPGPATAITEVAAAGAVRRESEASGEQERLAQARRAKT